MGQSPGQSGNDRSRRRSCRVLVHIPVQVKSDQRSKDSFEEDTQTLVVNAHGALVPLANPVRNGQTLRLKNKISTDEQTCKVVYLGPAQNSKVQVGIEFTAPTPHFWHIAFPPEDWSASSPEARTRNSG